MSIEKKLNYPDLIQEKKDQDLEILQGLLQKAIAAEEYEKAGVLKSFIDSNQDIDSLISELPEALASNDSFKCSVIDQIKEEKQKLFWEGKDDVDNSSLSALLNSSSKNAKELENRFNLLLIHLREEQGLLEIDYFIALSDYENQMEEMVKLSREKIANIWEPYQLKHGLKAEQFRSINDIPDYMKEPLIYWVNIYDNSKKLVAEFNEKIKEIKLQRGN